VSKVIEIYNWKTKDVLESSRSQFRRIVGTRAAVKKKEKNSIWSAIELKVGEQDWTNYAMVNENENKLKIK